jgi:hypothetical protein
MASTLNDNRPTGSVGSWTDAEVELDLAGGELGHDVASVGAARREVGSSAPVER